MTKFLWSRSGLIESRGRIRDPSTRGPGCGALNRHEFGALD